MNTPREIQFGSDTAIFHQLWAIAAITAAISAIPVAIWGEQFPWLIAIPVIIGVGWALYIEFANQPDGLFSPEATVSTLPPAFKGLIDYRKNFGLHIETASEIGEMQMNLFGEPETNRPQRKVIRLRDEKGRSFTLVECDRFMAKVNTVIAEDVRRAAEHAFKTGWNRIEQIAQHYPEIAKAFEDPLVLDAVKADFQSNVSICIAKSSDIAAHQFLIEANDANVIANYRIAPEKSKSTTHHKHGS